MINSVSVIIPSYNTRHLLEKNLPTLLSAKEYKVNNIIEIIVVDDKSPDDSVAYIEKTWKGKIKLIRHTKNRGFSSAVNTGVRSAKGELLCLINTDVLVSENFLQSAVKHFSNEKIFGVSLHEDGYGFAGATFKDGFINFRPGKELEKAHETFWISGGSGLFNRKIWMKLGGLDEKLLSPFYWEDFDLSYRAQKRGYKLFWEPNAKVIHEHESTMSKLRKGYLSSIRQRNELLIIWKNITSQRLFKKHLQGLLKRLLKHPGYARIVFLAFLKINLIIKARKKEKKEAVVSDEAVFARFE